MTAIITLTSDFGLQDGFVGVMKGVIWGIAPDARIADLTHLVSPQNVREGAVALDHFAPYFPEGTIHVAVIDPGVGTKRRPIAARLGALRFVGPDNGLLTLLLKRARRENWPVEMIELNQPKYWRAEITSTFHGRDIFASVAAHLANGVPLSAVGSPISDPVLLPISDVQRTASGLRGEIMHIDHFGNLSTNIRREDVSGWGDVLVCACGREVRGLTSTFGERAAGELIAYINSVGELALAVVNGNAARMVGATVGDAVEVVRAKPG